MYICISFEVWRCTCTYISFACTCTCSYISFEVWTCTCTYISFEVWTCTCTCIRFEVEHVHVLTHTHTYTHIHTHTHIYTPSLQVWNAETGVKIFTGTYISLSGDSLARYCSLNWDGSLVAVGHDDCTLKVIRIDYLLTE